MCQKNGLEDFFIISDLDDSYQNGHLAITGKFWQDKGQQVQLELMDQQGKKRFLKRLSREIKVRLNFQQVYRLSLLGQLKNHTCINYLSLFFSEGEVVEVIPQKVGFRNIHVSGETFLSQWCGH